MAGIGGSVTISPILLPLQKNRDMLLAHPSQNVFTFFNILLLYAF